MNSSITLTPDQVHKLVDIVDNFELNNDIELETSNSSGIGPSVRVKLSLFEQNDTVIDITDYSVW